MEELIKKVEQWFIDRDLHLLDGKGQLKKLTEEANELIDAHYLNNLNGEIDAVGDITVVLIGYCMQRGLDFEHCLATAYNEIKHRRGKVVDGVFVKESGGYD